MTSLKHFRTWDTLLVERPAQIWCWVEHRYKPNLEETKTGWVVTLFTHKQHLFSKTRLCFLKQSKICYPTYTQLTAGNSTINYNWYKFSELSEKTAGHFRSHVLLVIRVHSVDTDTICKWYNAAYKSFLRKINKYDFNKDYNNLFCIHVS